MEQALLDGLHRRGVRLRSDGEIAELGVDDLNAVLFPVEGDPDAVRRTAELLGESGGVSPSRPDPMRPN